MDPWIPQAVVRLSANESPFGPPPAAVQAMKTTAASANLYPEDQSDGLRHAIAQHEGVTLDQVAVGPGASALIMDLSNCICRPGEAVLAFEHSYIVYQVAAGLSGASFVVAATGASFERSADSLLDALRPSVRVVFVDNPGNPTGVHLDRMELHRLIRDAPQDVVICVDEAYVHYAAGQRGYAAVAELAVDHPQLVYLRTFSKAYGLAGARVGYLIGPPTLVKAIRRRRFRFHVSAFAESGAIAALQEAEFLATTSARTIAGRRRLALGLAALKIPFLDGLGNFLLVDLGQPSKPVVHAFMSRGILVEPLTSYLLDHCIRVSVGLPEQVERFLKVSSDVLDGIASRGRSMVSKFPRG